MHSDERATAALVDAAAAGDASARDQLVRAYLPLVHNIVGRALDGHADVDDVVQETMFRALDGLPALRDPARFRSWLVAIAMNQIRRRWRERQAGPLPGLDRAAELPDPGGDFVDLTILRLGLSGQRREVAEATRWLDESDRELLALWWLEASGELTRAELADALAVPPPHAAVRVQRMKERLETARAVVRVLAARRPCAGLARVTTGWDGSPTPLWRRRVARHLNGCGSCDRARSGLAPAEGLLAGLGLVVPLLGWSMGGDGSGGGAPYTDVQSVAWADTAPAAGVPAAVPDGPGPGEPGGRGGSSLRRACAAGVVALGVLGGLTLLVPSEPEARPLAPRTPAAAPPPPSSEARPTPAPRPSTATPTSAATASRSPAPDPAPAVEETVTALVNRRRAEAGCAPLRTDPRLAAAARDYARDMVRRGYYDHRSPEGRYADARISAAGYAWSGWAENLAQGADDPAGVVEGWMDGALHQENMLNCRYRDTGVAAVPGPRGTVWVQKLATPAS
ncbi:sigma-70 family RNA polymerase sigma factor [Streptomyces sp. QHH-9511]|uniref:sigma-70 family RNA polymerase sigma factor n=1 Tax=Streptomyces sp. QHH-9511 TaxID=2684468 RepID=UPI0013179250|nr:sigma-70 family RNA polymerase sigma factor [Streptomyces sp. QHH-9511]QGZ47528.1 sigma-70 family RNA polymerase sigma factor [Streptomyces sp. QHH-9511]